MRICFFGDSIVNGTHDIHGLGWPGRVCSAAIRAGHEVTHYNLGIRRNTSADVAGRWVAESESRLSAGHDGRVVFSFGTNDTVIENGRLRVDFESTLGNASLILGEAKGKYPCLWVGPAPVDDAAHNERLRSLCAAFRELAGKIGVAYLPVLEPLMGSSVWMGEVAAGDGAHPQNNGYGELARLVQEWDGWWFRD
ncbi:lipase [bacterium]|nr:MAG: lipase [bacterium]